MSNFVAPSNNQTWQYSYLHIVPLFTLLILETDPSYMYQLLCHGGRQAGRWLTTHWIPILSDSPDRRVCDQCKIHRARLQRGLFRSETDSSETLLCDTYQASLAQDEREGRPTVWRIYRSLMKCIKQTVSIFRYRSTQKLTSNISSSTQRSSDVFTAT